MACNKAQDRNGIVTEFEEGRKFFLSKSTEVELVVKPMLDYLGVQGFTFQRLYKDGRRFLLSSDPKWLDFF